MLKVIDDNKDEMPQQICIYCSRKLKSSYAFIKQVQKANDKLWSLKNTPTNHYPKVDCLEESEIDIDKCLEIKMETDDADVGEKDLYVIKLLSEEYNLKPKKEMQDGSDINEDDAEKDVVNQNEIKGNTQE